MVRRCARSGRLQRPGRSMSTSQGGAVAVADFNMMRTHRQIDPHQRRRDPGRPAVDEDFAPGLHREHDRCQRGRPRRRRGAWAPPVAAGSAAGGAGAGSAWRMLPSSTPRNRLTDNSTPALRQRQPVAGRPRPQRFEQLPQLLAHRVGDGVGCARPRRARPRVPAAQTASTRTARSAAAAGSIHATARTPSAGVMVATCTGARCGGALPAVCPACWARHCRCARSR